MDKQSIKAYYNSIAPQRQTWMRRNRHYHRLLKKYFSSIVPENSKVLEIGCGSGDLLASLKPSYGTGIDFSEQIIEIGRLKYPDLEFFIMDAENLNVPGTYDYIIMSDLVGALWDVQAVFGSLPRACHSKTKVIISYFNYMWEPLMKISEALRIKLSQPLQNWLSDQDISGILSLTGFETIRVEKKILFPKYFPLFSWFCNNYLANLPLIRQLTMVNFIVARPVDQETKDYSVSIIVPARNEKGNIENVILKTPVFGRSQEFVFVEGNSNDGTYDEICRIISSYPSKIIRILKQTGTGKGNAVREGFDIAEGEILFILDADLTTPPEDLPKFYDALKRNKGEFVNGCRLVYPMEKQAMRFLNLVANKFFGVLFSYLLGQRLKDTLCGTKVLFKQDYELIKKNRIYFGNFDPFGDFDLLFGAAKLNLKIVEVNVRYRDRQYGTTQISRFKHGWLLIKMAVFASKKLKFN